MTKDIIFVRSYVPLWDVIMRGFCELSWQYHRFISLQKDWVIRKMWPNRIRHTQTKHSMRLRMSVKYSVDCVVYTIWYIFGIPVCVSKVGMREYIGGRSLIATMIGFLQSILMLTSDSAPRVPHIPWGTSKCHLFLSDSVWQISSALLRVKAKQTLGIFKVAGIVLGCIPRNKGAWSLS